jgi:hypothetical protein
VDGLQVVFNIFNPFKVLAAESAGPILDVVVGDEVTLESLVSEEPLIANRTAHIPGKEIR